MAYRCGRPHNTVSRHEATISSWGHEENWDPLVLKHTVPPRNNKLRVGICSAKTRCCVLGCRTQTESENSIWLYIARIQDQRQKQRMLHCRHSDDILGLDVLFPQYEMHSAMLEVKDPLLPKNRLRIFMDSIAVTWACRIHESRHKQEGGVASLSEEVDVVSRGWKRICYTV